MPLPTLENWESTRDALHKAAQVVSAVKRLGVERDEHFYHHHVLKVVGGGLSSGKTDFGEFSIDFTSQTLNYRAKTESEATIPLADHNQKTLMDALVKAVRDAGLSAEPDRKDLDDETPFALDPEKATAYFEALYGMNKGLTEVRQSMMPYCTELVVFPHHFDLSYLWFNRGFDNENQPHVNFGFSPGDSSIPYPYFYAYAWDGKAYVDIDVEPPLLHEPEFSTGVLMSYNDIIAVADDPTRILKGAAKWIRDEVTPILWG